MSSAQFDQFINVIEGTNLQFSRCSDDSIETPFGKVKVIFDDGIPEFQCSRYFVFGDQARCFADFIDTAIDAWAYRFIWEKDKYNPFPINTNSHELWEFFQDYSFPEDVSLTFAENELAVRVYYLKDNERKFCMLVDPTKASFDYLYYTILGMIGFCKEFDDSIPTELNAIAQ